MMKLIFTGELISYKNHTNVVEQIEEGHPRDPLALRRRRRDLDVLRDPLRLPLGDQSRAVFRPALTILALVGISIPVFWLAALFLIYLTFKIELFPSGGYVALTENPLEWAYHLILPWMTLSFL